MKSRSKTELLALLKRAQVVAESMTTASTVDDASLADRLRAEARRHEQFINAFVLAYISDQPSPISLFRPWASYGSFRRWELTRRIKLHRANGKVCVEPNEFFRFWKTLMAEGGLSDNPRAKNAGKDSAGAGQE